MLVSVQFLARELAETFPAAGEAVLSITAPGEYRPLLEQFSRVGRISFDDLDEETLGLLIGDLPDEVVGANITWGAFVLPDARHAAHIVEFVQALANDAQPFSLVVHCHSGISRSAAVARFVSEHFAVPLLNNADTSGANARLFRLLAAIAQAQPIRTVAPAAAPNLSELIEHRRKERELGGVNQY